MKNINETYHNLLNKVLDEGYDYLDPNRQKQGVYRKQINKFDFEYDMSNGFPAISTKKLAFKGVVGETLWILKGLRNIKYLVDNGIPIWTPDSYNYYLKRIGKNDEGDYNIEPMGMNTFLERIKDDKNHEKSKVETSDYKLGDVGRNYGVQLRDWGGENNSISDVTEGLSYGKGNGIDQLKKLIKTLKNNPMATKKIITYWNPSELNETALTPCHRSFEVMCRPTTREEKIINPGKYYELSLSFDMSSSDVFLGLPFNIASYGLILNVLAKLCNMTVGKLYGSLTNVHIYHAHLDAVREQLGNDVDKHPSCELSDFSGVKMDMRGNVDEWLNSKEISDFKLNGYSSYPPIKAKMLAYDQ